MRNGKLMRFFCSREVREFWADTSRRFECQWFIHSENIDMQFYLNNYGINLFQSDFVGRFKNFVIFYMIFRPVLLSIALFYTSLEN